MHTATPEEEVRTNPETLNESHSETLDSVIMDKDDEDGELLGKVKLAVVLKRKARLRKRLLRMEHHTQFLKTAVGMA